MNKKEVIAIVSVLLVLALSSTVSADDGTISYEALLAMISLALVIFVTIMFLVYKLRRAKL